MSVPGAWGLLGTWVGDPGLQRLKDEKTLPLTVGYLPLGSQPSRLTSHQHLRRASITPARTEEEMSPPEGVT